MNHRTSKDINIEDDKTKNNPTFVLDEIDLLLGIDNLISVPKESSQDLSKELIESRVVKKKIKTSKKMQDLFQIDPDLARVDAEEYKRQIKIQKEEYLLKLKKGTPKMTSKRSDKSKKGKNMEDIFGNLDNLDPELFKQTIRAIKEEFIRSIKPYDLNSISKSDQVKPETQKDNDIVEIGLLKKKRIKLDAFDRDLQDLNIDELRLELEDRKKNYIKYVKSRKVSEIAVDLSHLEMIINFISSKSSDFSNYKPSFIYRRIKKRISRLKIHSLSDYLEHLKFNPDEMGLLKIELSINVTQFMRDKSTWKYLETILLPQVIMKKKRKIKLWSAAAAIGCEAYSLAIINHKNSNANYELISTDINNKLLAIARLGYYESNHVKELSPSDLSKYFNYKKGRYKIKSFLKTNNRIYQLDLFSDIFPNKVDIILARNVWIYFEKPELVYKKMYNSLNCDGYLILGGTEIVPKSLRHMFKLVNVSTQTYQKICN